MAVRNLIAAPPGCGVGAARPHSNRAWQGLQGSAVPAPPFINEGAPAVSPATAKLTSVRRRFGQSVRAVLTAVAMALTQVRLELALMESDASRRALAQCLQS